MNKKKFIIKYYEWNFLNTILFYYIFFNLLKNISIWDNQKYIGYNFNHAIFTDQFKNKIWSLKKIPPKFFTHIQSFFQIYGVFIVNSYFKDNKNQPYYTFIILNELLTKKNKSLDGDVYVGIFYTLWIDKEKGIKKSKDLINVPLSNNKDFLFEKTKKYKQFSFSSKVIIKVIPLKNNLISKPDNNLFETFNELKLLKLNNELINRNICPFFIKVYNYFTSKMKQDYYENPNIKKYFYNHKKIKKLKSKISLLKKALVNINTSESYRQYKSILKTNLLKKKKVLHDLKSEFKNFGKKGLFIIMEFGEFNLKDYFQNKIIYDDIVYQLVFQILVACYSQSKFNKIVHFDLHGSNILINETNIIDYNYANYSFLIDNKKYTTNNLGLEIKLIDYGRSFILNKENKVTIYKKLIKQGERFFPKKFTTNNNKKILHNLKTIPLLSNYIYSFDIWRISSYLLILLKSLNLDTDLSKSNRLLKKIKSETEKKWIDELINPSSKKISKNYNQNEELLENLFYTKKQFRKKTSTLLNVKSFDLNKK